MEDNNVVYSGRYNQVVAISEEIHNRSEYLGLETGKVHVLFS